MGPRRNKFCNFCLDKMVEVPYKDGDLLRRYLTDRGKIRPRRQTEPVRSTSAAWRVRSSAHATWLYSHSLPNIYAATEAARGQPCSHDALTALPRTRH